MEDQPTILRHPHIVHREHHDTTNYRLASKVLSVAVTILLGLLAWLGGRIFNQYDELHGKVARIETRLAVLDLISKEAYKRAGELEQRQQQLEQESRRR